MKAVKALPLLAFLLVLGGCMGLFQPQLDVSPLSQEGEVSEQTGGFVAHWAVAGGDGTHVVDFGDGLNDTFTDTTFIEHLYTQAGAYRVVITSGMKSAAVDVVVTAPGFTLNYPFWIQGDLVDERELLHFDPFPRTTGCDNGEALNYFGVWPSNEDFYKDEWMFRYKWNTDRLSEDFEMRVYVRNSDGARGHVYGKDAQLITGEWVSLQTFRVLADWPWARPPYPLEILQKACDPVVCPDDPWLPPEISDGTDNILIRWEVRSKWGVVEAIQWNVYVATGGCE